MNKPLPSFRKLRNGSNHQVNTQSRQRGPFVQAIKGPLNPQSYPTSESYLQVREPKSITSGLRAAQISEPRLMVSAIIWKPVKKLRVQKENSKLDVETRSTSDIFKGTLQFMNWIFSYECILLTSYDMKCSYSILIQQKQRRWHR